MSNLKISFHPSLINFLNDLQANMALIFKQILKSMALLFIGIYRSLFTAHFGAGVCRFEPSCSKYANEAFLRLPLMKATKLVAIRLIKCRPGSDFGFDPVPDCNPINRLSGNRHER